MTVKNAPDVKPLGFRVLRGRIVTLVPFQPAQREALCSAAGADKFRYFPTPDFESWYSKACAEREPRHCYTVQKTSDGTVLGSTSYFDMSEKDGRVEIGSTWYSEEARGTATNPEAKLLLLGNAFDAGYQSVVLKTCSRNARSRAAILKLGAKEDGILRSAVWMPPRPLREGYFRDSVLYSILAEEWPTTRTALEARIAALQVDALT